ncbi:unnamed protein product [Chironomus riparius]|uniref:Protein kinase domain-containing protein n=1 Tax=Chironomus riparius TaxID=315576 RepID=A0A9N9WYG9_9DIPT|nr:unnamed protein product [Chironomus riparius]
MDTFEVETIEVGEIAPDAKLSNGEKLYRGRLRKSIKNVVVKIIPNQEFEDFKKRVNREIYAAKANERNQNVLSVEKIEVNTNDGQLYIAYEDFDHTLKNIVDDTLNKPIKQILLTATEGLMHFHDKKFVHRNIRPENIVIKEENSNYNGKIADLSMSKLLTDGKNVTISRDFSENGFSAPELINYFNIDQGNKKKSTNNSQRKKVTEKVDIFSMGVVYFYAFTEYHPFARDGRSLQQNICDKKFVPNFNTLKKSKSLSAVEVPLITNLIQKMIQYDPKKRPTIKQVLNHPFFWTDQRKVAFLTVTSQYIQGCDMEDKESMRAQCGPSYENWQENLDPKVQETLKEKRKYKNDVTELLRSLRNLPAHVNEKRNEDLRNFFNQYQNGVVGYFSEQYPYYFIDFYNYFIEYSSYDTLREFYCDCYVVGRYGTHKCNQIEAFCAFDWETN